MTAEILRHALSGYHSWPSADHGGPRNPCWNDNLQKQEISLFPRETVQLFFGVQNQQRCPQIKHRKGAWHSFYSSYHSLGAKGGSDMQCLSDQPQVESQTRTINTQNQPLLWIGAPVVLLSRAGCHKLYSSRATAVFGDEQKGTDIGLVSWAGCPHRLVGLQLLLQLRSEGLGPELFWEKWCCFSSFNEAYMKPGPSTFLMKHPVSFFLQDTAQSPCRPRHRVVLYTFSSA